MMDRRTNLKSDGQKDNLKSDGQEDNLKSDGQEDKLKERRTAGQAYRATDRWTNI